MAPSSSGLGRRPLKPVTPVRIRSGLPPTRNPCSAGVSVSCLGRRALLDGRLRGSNLVGAATHQRPLLCGGFCFLSWTPGSARWPVVPVRIWSGLPPTRDPCFAGVSVSCLGRRALLDGRLRRFESGRGCHPLETPALRGFLFLVLDAGLCSMAGGAGSNPVGAATHQRPLLCGGFCFLSWTPGSGRWPVAPVRIPGRGFFATRRGGFRPALVIRTWVWEAGGWWRGRQRRNRPPTERARRRPGRAESRPREGQ